MARPKSDQVANFLKEKRLKLGMTQREVGERLGLDSSQFVYMMERNIAKVPRKMLKPLAKILKLSRQELEEIARLEIEAATREIRHTLGL